MRLIAHRGNFEGPSQEENEPEYIDKALEAGYDAEVDIWKIGDNYFLGHDIPEYKVTLAWILKHEDNLWLHAKNFEALDALIQHVTPNVFWHEDDTYAMTARGHLWSYPEVYDNNAVYAWCSDYVGILQESKNATESKED